MYKFKQFMLQAQKQKKCPTGYRFDKKLQVCVPIGVTRYYPYFGGKNDNGQNDQQSSDNNTNDNGTNGNGNGTNGTNGNGSNGNGGGE
jgi:hypothetical protein